MSSEEGLTIARERITREAREKTGFLDLGHLGLTELPIELFALTHLRALNLGGGYPDSQGEWQAAASNLDPNEVREAIGHLSALPVLQSLFLNDTDLVDLATLARLPNLQSLDCRYTEVSDLAPLAGLPTLRSLICTSTPVSDLAPLAGLPNLQSLNCVYTQVSDLAPLGGLATLQTLDCASTQVTDLAPLAGLPNLRSLNCNYTQVRDLAPLAGLATLQTLDCSDTPVSDLAPLAGLANLQSLECSSTQVSDLTPLAGLASLETLACSNTKVSDLVPLAGLPNLHTLACGATQVSDLAPLAGLPNLQTLDCTATQVSDLAPLASLPNLRWVSCFSTQVSDLAPLAELTNLQSLDCSETQVSNLAPLAGLTNLQSLDCSNTQVGDLAPLSGLANLQSLLCLSAPVSDLAPLAGLANLQLLHCSGTNVSDLAALASLPNLQRLDCSSTRVSDLAPLASLPNLQELDCSSTWVSDLAPLASLPSLQELDCSSTRASDLAALTKLADLHELNCSYCSLTSIPEELLFSKTLSGLVLYQTRIPGIPADVLSEDDDDDCLDALRAHFRDLSAGADQAPDVKLLVLGNGRVGKTQMCRRLRGEPFDEAVESTHGIIVTSAPLRQPEGRDEVRLQIWDFGGQDIYLGTHALFMRSRAIFALLWIPEAEQTPEHRHGGVVFRNQPLAYWLEYVRHFGGSASPIVVIQTRCENGENDRMAPLSNDTLEAFRPLPKFVHYSALNERGRPSLDDALSQSVASLREKEGGVAVIGAGRAKVKRRIEAMRDADAARPPLEKQHRTISYPDYLKLCQDTGGISHPRHLLAYLHNAGTVFFRDGLFENRIIIDQGWALESIYAVFNRQKCYGRLAKQKGRFTRSDLAEWIWDQAGHNMQEQELFISMMQSCGICFQHRSASHDGKIEAEYIAPDLLPEKPESEIEQKWDTDRPVEIATFQYALLPQALMRGIIARIGSSAGLDADYWRDGVYVYEATTGSRGLIEQKTTGLWQGEIRAQAQRGQAGVLLERLVKLIEEEQSRAGTTPSSRKVPPTRALAETETTLATEKRPAIESLKFAQEPAPGPELFVSYAWGDDTADGRKREEVVDRLCAAAERQGITILRDKKTLGLGERISKFMNRIGQGGRIFVVLSDKYLKSPYCMYELMEVWRNCLQDEQKFLDRIRILVLPDVQISRAVQRVKYAAYWNEQLKELESAMKPYQLVLLGEKDFKECKMMQQFSNQVSDILAAIADIVQPRSYEEFEQYALHDLLGNSGAGSSPAFALRASAGKPLPTILTPPPATPPRAPSRPPSGRRDPSPRG